MSVELSVPAHQFFVENTQYLQNFTNFLDCKASVFADGSINEQVVSFRNYPHRLEFLAFCDEDVTLRHLTRTLHI